MKPAADVISRHSFIEIEIYRFKNFKVQLSETHVFGAAYFNSKRKTGIKIS